MKTELRKRGTVRFGSLRRGFGWVLVLLLALLVFGAGSALALPAGQQVVNGQVSIERQGDGLTITNSPNSIINWQRFSIGANEVVRFVQQNGRSAVLNRVTGREGSIILGALQSNGRVFLINPNGILFGQGARIDVGGLVASTLNLSNRDFLRGRYGFSAGPSAGALQNQGTITTPEGGQVCLIAPDIENSGLISSPRGEVLLAAGRSVQLVDSLDPDIAVVVSAPADQAVNLGQIVAQSGRVGIYGALIAQAGVVSADSALLGSGGQIVFKASQAVSLAAGSRTSATGGQGGEVQVLGRQVEVAGDIDASGRTGGGTVLVGGGYQGQNAAVPNAETTYVGPNATIRADAIEAGNGGQVVVWANDTTEFRGAISARGGVSGGEGGSAEVSGKQRLVYQGTADLTAPQGHIGTLLLDPADFTIAPSGGDITGTALGTQLGLAHVTIQTGSSGGQAGDITVNDPVSWGSSATLTLLAHNDINVNAALTNDGGGSLVLHSDWDGNGAGTVAFGTGGHVTLTGGGSATIYYNPAGGYTAPTDYSAHFTGAAPTAYMLVNNVNDLQNMNDNWAGDYALGADIDAGATAGWNSGAGFVPIGNDTNYPNNLFGGIFEGGGHLITNLHINRPGADYIALFGGTLPGAIVRNVGLVNENITGGFQTAGLVAHNMGTITNSFTTGTVTGGQTVGGLVGLNGTIVNCYSLATVSGSTFVGGLAGANYGSADSITNSYSAGAVSGSSSVGGLTGWNHGTITNSYWDIDTSGQSTSYGGTGLHTPAMKNQGSFVGWDFAHTWGIHNGASYPYLVWHGSGGTGSAASIAVQLAMQNTVRAFQKVPGSVPVYASLAEWAQANNIPWYASGEDYLKAHPPLAISWTEQAPLYDSWADFLKANPWFITAIAMNKSPQLDAEGNFIEGLCAPLDYLTTVGSGGIGFAGLDQGGAYPGYAEGPPELAQAYASILDAVLAGAGGESGQPGQSVESEDALRLALALALLGSDNLGTSDNAGGEVAPGAGDLLQALAALEADGNLSRSQDTTDRTRDAGGIDPSRLRDQGLDGSIGGEAAAADTGKSKIDSLISELVSGGLESINAKYMTLPEYDGPGDPESRMAYNAAAEWYLSGSKEEYTTEVANKYRAQLGYPLLDVNTGEVIYSDPSAQYASAVAILKNNFGDNVQTSGDLWQDPTTGIWHPIPGSKSDAALQAATTYNMPYVGTLAPSSGSSPGYQLPVSNDTIGFNPLDTSSMGGPPPRVYGAGSTAAGDNSPGEQLYTYPQVDQPVDAGSSGSGDINAIIDNLLQSEGGFACIPFL